MVKIWSATSTTAIKLTPLSALVPPLLTIAVLNLVLPVSHYTCSQAGSFANELIFRYDQVTGLTFRVSSLVNLL